MTWKGGRCPCIRLHEEGSEAQGFGSLLPASWLFFSGPLMRLWPPHDSISWNSFIIWKTEIIFTILSFWNWKKKNLRCKSLEALSALPVSRVGSLGCCRLPQNLHPTPSRALCLHYRRRQKYEPSCIWSITQCSPNRGNSFCTSAGAQLCPGAQDGHAL